MTVLNLAAVREAPVKHEPYDFLLGSDFLDRDAIEPLRRDFPDIRKPGYLTIDEVKLKGAFKELIDELEGPVLTRELSKKFGLDLASYPRLTTIMKRSQQKYGAIHTDGPSKVMTMLVYMNDDWDEGGAGRLRVLYCRDAYEPYAVEIPPVMGTVFAFLRSDKSWHGHKPFVGERRVVQVAWVKSQEDLDRKRKHNRFAQVLKGIFGR